MVQRRSVMLHSTLHTTAPFGDLVVAVFDQAAARTSDPRQISDLAARAIDHMLRTARAAAPTRSAPAATPSASAPPTRRRITRSSTPRAVAR